MDYLVAVHSDIGIRKSTNQDSVLLQVAHTDIGNIAFSVICDGMGGLAKGELASATLIREFAKWFQYELPRLLQDGFSEEKLNNCWKNIILTQGKKIGDFGKYHGFSLGTTCVVLLIMQNRYYIANVGDSRVYKINKMLCQLTKDQTYVQREMDMGRMTPEEARVDPQRNVLLQCVGASEYIEPDFSSGSVEKDDVFMLCSDGFRHTITQDEMYQYLNPNVLVTEKNMLEYVVYLTDLNKYRREEDNISAALIKVC
jgi:serine/threonine protein phosphatase PrpC